MKLTGSHKTCWSSPAVANEQRAALLPLFLSTCRLLNTYLMQSAVQDSPIFCFISSLHEPPQKSRVWAAGILLLSVSLRASASTQHPALSLLVSPGVLLPTAALHPIPCNSDLISSSSFVVPCLYTSPEHQSLFRLGGPASALTTTELPF